jgi:hypothetical protein
MLGLKSPNGFFVFFLFIGMAFAQGSCHPCQHIVIECEMPEDRSKPFGNNFFAHIRLRAFSLIAGAMVINVTALFKLANEGAAAMTTIDKAGEGKVSLRIFELAGVAHVEHGLYALPEIFGHQR